MASVLASITALILIEGTPAPALAQTVEEDDAGAAAVKPGNAARALETRDEADERREPEDNDDTEDNGPNAEAIERALRHMDALAPPTTRFDYELRQIETLSPPTPSQLGRPLRVGVIDRKRPLFDPRPVRIDGFNVYPEVYTSVTADSNVKRQPSGSSDLFVEHGASVVAESNWSRHALNLGFAASNRDHASHGSENFWTASGRVEGRVDVTSKFRLTADTQMGRQVESRDRASTSLRTRSPIRYNFVDASLGSRYESGRFDLSGSVQFQKRDFLNAVSPTGAAVDLQTRDSRRTLLQGTAGFAASGTMNLFATVRYDRLDYRLATLGERDSEGVRALAGIRGQLSPLINARLAAGVITRNYKSPALRSTSNFAFDARVEWLVTDLTTVTVDAKRDAVNSTNLLAAVELRTAFTATVDHELLRNVVVSAKVRHVDSDYAEVGQKDRSLFGALSARWMVSPRMEVYGQADAQRRSLGAALGGGGYRDARLTVGVKLRL